MLIGCVCLFSRSFNRAMLSAGCYARCCGRLRVFGFVVCAAWFDAMFALALLPLVAGCALFLLLARMVVRYPMHPNGCADHPQ